MSNPTILTYARAGALVPLILTGLWFSLSPSVDRFRVVAIATLICGLAYLVLTGVDKYGH